ncbi:MAG: hypothetical protein IPN79_11720 [Saprospiraceae bacterium]|nr:hypothetical protein [Saprospiraceae bacterium]
MKKLITWIVTGSLIVIVPFGSWYYLKQGLDYRKNALEALKPKRSLPEIPDSLNIFKGKTTLLVLDTTEADTITEPIYEQFKDAYTFSLAGNGQADFVLPLQKSILELLKNGDKSFAIIDTAGQIRNYYTREVSQLKLMVEHLAIVLPRAKDKDIKMK